MKTILTIGGDSYLLPKAADVSKILDLLQGVTSVKNRTVYGPDGDKRYEYPFYHDREVLADLPMKFRVELVNDEDVVSEKEFSALKAETERLIAALPPEPKESGSRS